ncbi:MAG: DUF1150 domain-containing protein [Pseudomonadota bacterium]|nr:DUF1150 domain-containing protein [Pseudomonadota bacterium]
MTRILSEAAFAALGAPELVYVREVSLAEVLASTPVDAVEGIEFDADQPLYAVHGADGARLAVVTDRDTAFAAALAHELTPVAVH